MRSFTSSRNHATTDELWLVEHDPVFTLGVAGRDEHVLDAAGIAVVRTGRGGQVTYHGPGQVVAYPLVDLRRLRIYVKEYVYRLEQAALDVLSVYGLTGHRVPGAPGIFIRLDDPASHRRLVNAARMYDRFEGLGKVAALGIKVSNHCAYYGLAFNVAMDLEPFSRINPCGFAGLATVDLATLGVPASWDDVAQHLGARLSALLSA
jgi:lipoyl(octanoyl) transferase